MKLEGLKQLVKEELAKALNPTFVKDLIPGKYSIEFKYRNFDEVGFDKIILDITSNDIEMDGDISLENFINGEYLGGKVVSIKSIEKVG